MIFHPKPTLCYKKILCHVIILHLYHLGTMFDFVAKQMGVPKGQFSLAWPRSVWFSIMCIGFDGHPLFLPTVYSLWNMLCHQLNPRHRRRLRTHIQPTCHFVQDADSVLCACVRVCAVCTSAAFDILVHQLDFQEGDASVSVLKGAHHEKKAADLTVCLLFSAFCVTWMFLRVCVGGGEWVPAHPAGGVQVSSKVCLVTAAAHD